jgi:hypothetical protein
MKNLLIVLIIVLGLLSRLIPHPVNFTALTAVALLAGCAFPSRVFAMGLPFLLMLVTDAMIGFHSTMFFTYGSLILVALLSHQFMSEQSSWSLRGGMSLLGSMIFFFGTNFGVWWVGELYTRDLAGLMQSYVMALPFLKNQILGDLTFTLALFYVADRLIWKSSVKKPLPSQVQ